MLSRIAESLFWIGRYVERADDTARILDVHLHAMVEDAQVDVDALSRGLLRVMDQEVASEGPVTSAEVLGRLAYDRESPSAIAGALVAARENARRAREVISTDLWECLNTTHNRLGATSRLSGHAYLAWVRERSAVVAGLMDSSTSRDATWQFMMLGRSIERADMTARLLAAQVIAGGVGPEWTMVLRACGAQESFLRTYRGRATDERAAGFLLVDRSFPRSIVFALERADRCLRELEHVGTDEASERPAVISDVRRRLSLVRSSLEFRPFAEILADLPAEMEEVQRVCSAASDLVRQQYFPSAVQVTWVEEAL